jgi:hypothetical protein
VLCSGRIEPNEEDHGLSTDDLAIEIELHGYLDGALDPIRAAPSA